MASCLLPLEWAGTQQVAQVVEGSLLPAGDLLPSFFLSALGKGILYLDLLLVDGLG